MECAYRKSPRRLTDAHGINREVGFTAQPQIWPHLSPAFRTVAFGLAFLSQGVSFAAHASDTAALTPTRYANQSSCWLEPRRCHDAEALESVVHNSAGASGPNTTPHVVRDQTKVEASRKTSTALALRYEAVPPHQSNASDSHDGTGQIVVGATLTGLGAVSGVLSVLTGIQAAQIEEQSDDARVRPANDSSNALAHTEVKAGAQRDGVESNGRGTPTSAAEYRRLSLGLAVGAGVLLSAGGLLIYRGLVAKHPVELHLKPVIGKRRTLVHVRATF